MASTGPSPRSRPSSSAACGTPPSSDPPRPPRSSDRSSADPSRRRPRIRPHAPRLRTDRPPATRRRRRPGRARGAARPTSSTRPTPHPPPELPLRPRSPPLGSRPSSRRRRTSSRRRFDSCPVRFGVPGDGGHRYHPSLMPAPSRPFITLLTDFGPDAAAAICRGVMLSIAPDAQIVDISHSVRKYAIRDGAYLLWISLPSMPVAVHVAVVDPGVGTARRPIGIRTGKGNILIGPDNGLLTPAASATGGIAEARVLENRAWMLPRTSSTFHGRDIFAPIGAHVAIGGDFGDVGPVVDPASLVTIDFPPPIVTEDGLDTTVIYIDSFGNLRLGGDPDDFARAFGDLAGTYRLEFEATDGASPIVEQAPWARTFGDIELGPPLLYEDSFGNLAYADNQSDAARRLGARVDQRVRIRRA